MNKFVTQKRFFYATPMKGVAKRGGAMPALKQP
jgi:hypothetical protein